MAAERDPWLVLGVSRTAAWPEIRAAYRALARRYHADGTSPDARCMVEINVAYGQIERDYLRGALPAAPIATPERQRVPVGPGAPGFAAAAAAAPAKGSLLDRMTAARNPDSPTVDFGQYAGWRIADIAECDPRYLRWLSRHSSGHRFRAAIAEALGPDPEIGRRAALIG